MGTSLGIYFAVLSAGAVLWYCCLRGGRLLRCAFFTAFSGLLALGALWLAGRFFPIPLTLTPFAALTASLLGVPGVIGMLIVAVV